MKFRMPQCLRLLTVAFVFSAAALAQSTDISFPTAMTSSSVSGTIAARAVGDARDTTHYFAFEGQQGDIFLNVSTKNLVGSIDVFSADTTRSFTRIPIFADVEVAETGRVIYLRRREKLLLRIQGRSPDDRPATYQVKFAGSFLAIADPKEDATPAPTLSNEVAGNVRVNSVGTIIPPEPSRPRPETEAPRAVEPTIVAEKKEEPVSEPERVEPREARPPAPQPTTPTARGVRRRTPPRVVVTDPVKPGPDSAQPRKPAPSGRSRTAAGQAAAAAPDPLANVRLVIRLKNGETIERSLPEVSRFSVTNGVLVVVGKDRMIWRYPMTEVASVNIQ
jgi:hypothetical protein